MGAKYKNLIEFRKVIDHDCGSYTIGEIDVGSTCIEEYIREYGEKGFNELTAALVFASERILIAYRSVNASKQIGSMEARV